MMMFWRSLPYFAFVGFFCAARGFSLSVAAQPIIPEANSAGTSVNINGQQFNIGGGTLSGDGTNLFHSFEQFGLDAGQVANFLTSPDIHNILGRVVGGDASIINGLIQVTGGNSHLFLMNPAGIVFGANASLNVPGDFTATTATGIGLGDDFFNAWGENNYSILTGNPHGFAFDLSQPGAIVNAGNLTATGGDLTLLGGSVLNTGEIISSGNINIAAVPGTSLVRLSQPGTILTLELPSDRIPPNFSALDIPELLTTPTVQNATGIAAEDIQNAELPLDAGDVSSAGEIRGETVNLAAMSRVRVAPSESPWVMTGGGQYSAPTVTLFSEELGEIKDYVFIDGTVDDYQALLYGGRSGTISTVITPEEHGITKIAETLSHVSEVEEVHIVAEGNMGNFWLGQDFLDANSIHEYREQLQAIGESLSQNADILLYSCLTALGEMGNGFIESIAAETGADVAASTNLTGHSSLGGDWVLEASTGNIEASLAFTDEALDEFEDALAVITVTNERDYLGFDSLSPHSAHGTSLREAIQVANNNQPSSFYSVSGHSKSVRGIGVYGNDEIRFASYITYIELHKGELEITDDLKITGGMTNITINDLSNGRIFKVVGGVTTTFENLTLRNGIAYQAGGAILSDGTVNLNNTKITGFSSSGDGGAISANTVNLTNSRIYGNTSNGRGGGISANTVTLTNSRVYDNFSNGNGGGISSNGNVTLNNSMVSGNSSNGDGGGISTDSLTLENSTVFDNSSNGDGGGISTDSLTLINSTVSGNSSDGNGGGIHAKDATIINGTIAFNVADANSNGTGDGGGIFRDGTTGAFSIEDSIIAQNTDNSNEAPDLSGTFDTIQYSLIQDLTGATITTDTNNIKNADPGLRSLAFYGGPTQTHALEPDSPAINAGRDVNIHPNTQAKDQRGFARNERIDMGAFESDIANPEPEPEPDPNPIPPPPPPPPPAPPAPPEPEPDTSTFRVRIAIFLEGFRVLSRSQSFESSPSKAELIDFVVEEARERGYNIRNENGTLILEALGRVFEVSSNDVSYDPEEGAASANFTTQRAGSSPTLPVFQPPLSLASNAIADTSTQTDTVAEEFAQDETVDEDTGEEESIENIRATIKGITQKTGTHPVIVYALSYPEQLELIVITPEEHIIRKVIPDASADRLQKTAANLRQMVTNPRRPDAYLASSQQLYNWLIAPIASELEGLKVDTLIFSLDAGLRTIPLAALHDGEQFLVEKYSLGVIPSVSLTNTSYAPLHDARVLAMGASEFSQYDPLPAVPVELSLIAEQSTDGTVILNRDFTLDNLKANSQDQSHQILHLATHADFQSGKDSNAYIQLWEEKMGFEDLRGLGWTQEDPIELLVLSACRTALGDIEAELGFAGLAVNTGAKSVLASLWYVSDGGTLNLMGDFYRHLRDPDVTIKAEALRRAQIAMIRQERQGEEFWHEIAQSADLDPASQAFLQGFGDRNFSHPYYWSAFTLVGSPW